MTGTIGGDGFCTRCQEPADWCACPPLPDDAEADDTSDTPEAPVSENPDALTRRKGHFGHSGHCS